MQDVAIESDGGSQRFFCPEWSMMRVIDSPSFSMGFCRRKCLEIGRKACRDILLFFKWLEAVSWNHEHLPNDSASIGGFRHVIVHTPILRG